jgi:hypothetical protein
MKTWPKVEGEGEGEREGEGEGERLLRSLRFLRIFVFTAENTFGSFHVVFMQFCEQFSHQYRLIK